MSGSATALALPMPSATSNGAATAMGVPKPETPWMNEGSTHASSRTFSVRRGRSVARAWPSAFMPTWEARWCMSRAGQMT